MVLSFRSQLNQAEWDALRVSIALVCRDAAGNATEQPDLWATVSAMLGAIGARAAEQKGEGDIALCVLTDFADEAERDDIIAYAQALVAELPESTLRAMTEKAAAIVDRIIPEQSFRFRATLVLVSLLVSGSRDAADQLLRVGTPVKF